LEDVPIEAPPDPKMGDFSSSVAFVIAKKEGRNPKEVAESIMQAIGDNRPRGISNITSMGPYINFFVNLEVYSRMVLEEIFDNGDRYGRLPRKGSRAIIEHTSVNPNKPLHMGTARNSILGDSVARLMDAAGYDVEIDNYIDDLGIQFAEVFWGLLNLDAEPDEKYDHFLGKLYIKVHEREDEELLKEIKRLNQELEGPKYAKTARDVVERCVRAQGDSLARLGIHHDLLVWESDIVHAGLFEETFERLKESSDIVLEEEGPLEGCLVMRLGRVYPKMKNPDKVLIRSDGTPTYTAKDIALQMWKFGLLEKSLKYCTWNESAVTSCPDGEHRDFGKADLVINIIGSEQSYPQEVVKRSLKLLGYDRQSENSYHMAYEFVTLPNESFSGRKGTWIGFSLDDVMGLGEKKAYDAVDIRRPDLDEEKKKAIAKAISAGSIRYNIVKYAPEKKIVFRWEDALNFEGDSCPYIVYAHARCCSIMKRVEGTIDPSYDYSHPKERELIKMLSQMPEVIEKASADKRPHYITKYANDVATRFNSFYNELPVLKSESRDDRLKLVDATRIVLANCLGLLGIEALEEM
ncbi:MAG TPA: arginine--tRNA ligase, partial [Candidatus Methanofastidiosa archaeon]|nr:arginine--tRNA ligase [Candidatus Methanofastidiosa archaeon]